MKKNKNNKKDRKLRQSIEILKAQLGSNTEIVSTPVAVKSTNKTVATTKIEAIDDSLIKKDLTKTLVLSAVGFAVILLLWSFDITSFRI